MDPKNLHSLDEMVIAVRDLESKRLAQEAVTAYQAGAYRASILSIWVAVCADIISKLRELAGGGDMAALAEIKILDACIKVKDLKKLQQFENGLIELANDKFGMLLPHEAIDLDRLRQDRHLCAHPAFVTDSSLFSPTPELVRAHLVHAMLHLLIRPPIQGKKLIDRFDRDLIGGSIPRKAEDIELVLRENYVSRAKPSSILGMIKALSKALVSVDAEIYKGKSRQIALTLAAMGRIFPGVYEEYIQPMVERLGRELEDDRVALLCRYMEAEPRYWQWLGSAGQARILAKIENSSLQGIIPVAFGRHIAIIGDSLLKRIKREEVEIQLSFLSRSPCEKFVPLALDLYSASTSYNMAEKRGMDLIVPHAKYFTVNDVAILNKIIRNNKYNQIIGASQTSAILIQVFDQACNLLPGSATHWSEIAKYIVDKKLMRDGDYPALIDEFRKSGIDVPDFPQEEDD